MTSRGQIKIQETAFVLVALVIFFALVSLLYLSFRIQAFKDTSADIREQEAQALVRKLAATPELRWECSGCIDLDKAIVLKERLGKNKSLEQLWDLEYLALETIYPEKQNKTCTLGIYPDCKSLVIMQKSEKYGKAAGAFVSLCRWETGRGYQKCELGKIYAAGRLINE